MKNNLSSLDEISRYRSSHPESHLIVDTSALLLFFIGIYDTDYLDGCPLFTENGKFYKKEHFELIKKILNRFPDKIIITPHVLSEINMLSKKIDPHKRNDYFIKLILELQKYKEDCIDLKVLLKNGGVIKFGFTDISLVEVAEKKKWIVLTDDMQFYIAFNNTVPMISFNKVVAMEQLF